MSNRPHAVLVLADGTVFHGHSIGAEGVAIGEVAFNTAMTGYQEILTDPSYCRQIVTLTYPHVGNTGINDEDTESTTRAIHAAGMVIRDLPLIASNWRSHQSLPDFLKRHDIPAIAGIDTRKLTRILRIKGAQAGCIMTGHVNESEALQQAQAFPGLAGMDLARVVSCTQSWEFSEGEWVPETGYRAASESQYQVAVLDFGVKRTILRKLVERGCHVTVYPAQTRIEEILRTQPDGVVLSNGPGDPEACDYAIIATRALLASRIPVFGICLGHQLIALAIGAKTIKMRFGHHGANHPVLDVDSGQVMITSQNHGFAVDADTLPANARVTHHSLFDGSLQGFELTDHPVFCFQGHPEASPGPRDVDYLFSRFVDRMARNKQSA
ncbi:carbamoyl-phosphate synthase small subunit [Nitrosomonas sp. HPC101]|uniref:glutamine-hydrolyzing carbamoyl-phosphate synthase small subunit n=1 Tax=Nitrosomonas sp. HPC101 TaxID=1658667 RepID=UPI00136DEB71|nr:carbamoyl-phosphate synthase small subunit [Nitrosomonas sp. HPC101]